MSSSQQLLLGEGAGGAAPVYIEDVFSTYLWTGNGTSQTITNNIDLSTKGGLVWIKRRDGVVNHYLATTNGGTSNYLNSNTTSPYETSVTTRITSFNTDGFSLGSAGSVNNSGSTFVGWTFRKQPKFFDIQTWTNGVVNHNLGSVPGCIIYKSTTDVENWFVTCRKSDGTYDTFNLNTNGANQFTATDAASAGITSTTFDSRILFGGTGTLIGYFFAHNAGGFGLTGTDNVISCGSYTGNGSATGPVVTLGYEPQWIIIKRTDSTGDWRMFDNMRGLALDGNTPYLKANTSEATSSTGATAIALIGTGFQLTATGGDYNASGGTYIYIAIRRGPMKVPTSGTTVFSPAYFTGNDSTSRQLTAGFVTDTFLGKRSIGDASPFVDRLRGKDLQLYTPLTNAEATSSLYCRFDSNTGPIVGYNAAGGININSSAYTYRTYSFGRAPSFHDVVCYTGTGSNRTVSHNLAAVPELMIIKARIAGGYDWMVYQKDLGNTLLLKLNEAGTGTNRAAFLNSTTPTASVFTVGTDALTNVSSGTFVAYLFATCAGVSKVGSYTGNGGSQTINCGFTSGARFVLIKKTSGTGDWNLWDSARGIVSGNDPYFALNSSDGEVTSNDSVDTNSTGFVVNEVAATNANESGATYIFLAIA